jgi:hypothetical protein
MRRAKGRPKAKATSGLKAVKAVKVPPRYELEPLDPWLMCGPDTTVTELWRVLERREQETHYHLVYFDRYGWYCEHGRGCGAVSEVRKVVRTMSANAPRPSSPVKAGTRKRK